MNESIGDRESIRARGRHKSRLKSNHRPTTLDSGDLCPTAWACAGEGWRLGALGAASTPGGRHNEAPPHPFCPRIPSGLLRVSRGPCSRRAIVAGPMALAVLGFGSGPMGMTGAVYIVPSDHYWEVI